MPNTLLLATALAIAISPFAHAGMIAQLDNFSLTGAPGDTLLFNVTLTDTSATDQIWLNGIGSTAASPFLTIDTSPFDLNAPLFLDPLANSGSFELFEVSIGPNTPKGSYIGSFVSILGGADGGTGSAFDDLADVSFDVNVQSYNTAVPEPRTFWMVGLVMLAVGLARRSRHKGHGGAAQG